MSARPRSSSASRITAACLLVAVVATGVAALVALRLATSTARDVTREVLADQAEVVAAQLAETGVRGGTGDVAEVLRGQGVTIVLVTPRGVVTADPAAAQAARRAGAERVRNGQPVSDTVTVGGTTLVLEARPARAGGFALVQPVDVAAARAGVLRRIVGPALLVGGIASVVAGVVVARLMTRPLRRTAAVATAMGSGRRDARVPVEGPAEVADVAESVNALADALARSEDRQRRFLRSVSHELRTPLTAVTGFAESLADGVVTGEDARTAGRTVQREAGQLHRLVDDLLELARLEADDFRLDPETVELAALLREAGEVWEARCRAAWVRFRLELGADAVRVRADRRRVRQVVDALADNALRATPAGAELILATGVDGVGAWLQVRDGGPGLAPDDYAVVFDHAVLHERHRHHRPTGVGGIGTALARGLVDRMGGAIHAGPAEEGGVCVTVRLPGDD